MPSNLDYRQFCQTIVPEEAPRYPFDAAIRKLESDTPSIIATRMHNSERNSKLEGIYGTGSGMQRRTNRQGLNAYHANRDPKRKGKKGSSERLQKKRIKSSSFSNKLKQMFFRRNKYIATPDVKAEIPFLVNSRRNDTPTLRHPHLATPKDIPFFRGESFVKIAEKYTRDSSKNRTKGRRRKRGRK